MNYWLMKSEPDAYSIDDLKRDKKTNWSGIRNYQARNFMRDEMRVGDRILFYASSADPSGVTGIAEVVREGYPEADVWSQVDIKFIEKFPGVVSLETLKNTKGLENMMVTRKGARLSVQPVTKPEFDIVVKLGRAAGRQG
jgi:predicted RNA-binding protein with PUA-like domain